MCERILHLDILYARPDTWLAPTPEWGQVYEARHLFLSQKLRHTFSSYAVSQLKRLQRHYQWLTHPPDHAPTLKEFGGRLEPDDKGGQTSSWSPGPRRPTCRSGPWIPSCPHARTAKGPRPCSRR